MFDLFVVLLPGYSALSLVIPGKKKKKDPENIKIIIYERISFHLITFQQT